ncbi:MAG: 30S ribosomal protein S4 [Candidatus Micrarchaeaceae archaeon]
MGSPKRLRKKYETPGFMWDAERLAEEHKLKDDYGLKNLRELWIAASTLRNVRRKAREVLSGKEREDVGKAIIAKLSRYGVIKPDATIDDLLVINIEALLERRLQSIVFRKGMAKSMKQARQLIAHGFIAINGRRITQPSYFVKVNEESAISFYKPINIMQENAQSA